MEFKKLVKTSAIISAIIGVTTVSFTSKDSDIRKEIDNIYNRASGYLQTIKDKNDIIEARDKEIEGLKGQLSTLKGNVILISNMLGVNEGLNADNFDMDNLATYITNIVNAITSNGEASEEQMNSLKAIANALGIQVGENATVGEITEAIIEEIGKLQTEIGNLQTEIEELEKQVEEYEKENGSLIEKIQGMEEELERASREEKEQLEYLQGKLTQLENLENTTNGKEEEEDKGGTEGAWQCAEHETVLVFATEEEFNNHIATEHKETNPTNAKEEAYNNLSANAKLFADNGYVNGDIQYDSNNRIYFVSSSTVTNKYQSLNGTLLNYNSNLSKYLVNNNITEADIEALNNWANM